MQLRNRNLLVTALSISLIFVSAPAYSASIAGSKCTKVGATKTISAKKYTCIKSGKNLIWNKGVALSSTNTSNTSTTSAAVQAKLGARMANIAAVQLLADRLWSNSQGLKVENPTAKLEKSVNTATRITAAKNARQMIMSFSPMFPNFDLNDFPVEKISGTNPNIAPAHGVMHLAQKFYIQSSGGSDSSLIPAWYAEGTASMFAMMVATEMAKRNPSYATLAAASTSDWSKTKCQVAYETWRTSDSAKIDDTNSCVEGLGQIMAEALINKSNALDKVLLVYQLVAIGNTFDEALTYAFGVNKADFFAEIDTLLMAIKW